MLTVEQIESGTVIDHIPQGKGLAVLHILNIGEEFKGRVALMINVPSKRMGRKDIVKVEGTFIDEKSADRIALIAPKATLNIIKGGKVSEKISVELPKEILGVFVCPNPKCVTNHEQVDTLFTCGARGICCRHCERCFAPEELAK
ncbi:Aspartate carbamoyltransferase regulatory chain [Candidatus Burarchaeum australiense]|nr:Aspartate carbamoyltransferase regulatory chain [Candidatus Burarchaeum australiense]